MSRGSGIPQVIAARRTADIDRRTQLIRGSATLWKVGLTLVDLLFGASIGREGPTVQLGACIMFLLGSYTGLRKPQGLLLAGAVAGIAAAFNAAYIASSRTPCHRSSRAVRCAGRLLRAISQRVSARCGGRNGNGPALRAGPLKLVAGGRNTRSLRNGAKTRTAPLPERRRKYRWLRGPATNDTCRSAISLGASR